LAGLEPTRRVLPVLVEVDGDAVAVADHELREQDREHDSQNAEHAGHEHDRQAGARAGRPFPRADAVAWRGRALERAVGGGDRRRHRHAAMMPRRTAPRDRTYVGPGAGAVARSRCGAAVGESRSETASTTSPRTVMTGKGNAQKRATSIVVLGSAAVQ